MKKMITALATIATLSAPLLAQAADKGTSPEMGTFAVLLTIQCQNGATKIAESGRGFIQYKDYDGNKRLSEIKGMKFTVSDDGDVKVKAENGQMVSVAKLQQSVSAIEFYGSTDLNSDKIIRGTCASLPDMGFFHHAVADIHTDTPMAIHAGDVNAQCGDGSSYKQVFSGTKAVYLKPLFVNNSTGTALSSGEAYYENTCVSLKSALKGAVKLPFMPLIYFFAKSL